MKKRHPDGSLDIFALMDDILNPGPIIVSAHQPLRDVYTGYSRGHLYVMVGHSGVGKSSLFISEGAKALKDGYSVAVWASPGSNDISYKSGYVCWNRLFEIQKKQNQFTLFDLDRISPVHQISLQAVQLKHQNMLDLIVIDSLDLGSLEEIPEQFEATLRMAYLLKRLARQLDVPIVMIGDLGNAVKQVDLNRPVTEQYYNGDPFLSYADVLMFCHRNDSYLHFGSDYKALSIYIDKNETGKEGWKHFRLLDPDSI